MRLYRPVTHLAPCVDAVAVCAKQPQITFVCLPVPKSVIPNTGSALVSKLSFWVNMVNIKNAIVSFPAFHARTTKGANQFKFSLPVARVLVRSVAVLIPIRLIAVRRAKTVVAFFPAFFARALFSPSGSKIAGLAAELSGSIFNAVSMNLKRIFAVRARYFDFGFFHNLHYIKVYRAQEPKYFDIACERISAAVGQGQLFAPTPTKQEQGALL